MDSSHQSDAERGNAPDVPEAAAGVAAAPEARGSSLGFIEDVPVRISVELGGTRMRVRDVLQLGEGSVVELDRMAGEPADVLVNGRVVARAELAVVEDRLAIRIVELVASGTTGRTSE